MFAVSALGAFVWTAKSWSTVRTDYSLLRTDWAISRMKSWRMRLESTDPKRAKDWLVIEAIPPGREHGRQHVDRTIDEGGSNSTRIAGDLEYIRFRDHRYFRGDGMFGHKGSSQWIKLILRDFAPLDGFFDLRLYITNPRTIGYSAESIETSFWKTEWHRVVVIMELSQASNSESC